MSLRWRRRFRLPTLDPSLSAWQAEAPAPTTWFFDPDGVCLGRTRTGRRGADTRVRRVGTLADARCRGRRGVETRRCAQECGRPEGGFSTLDRQAVRPVQP